MTHGSRRSPHTPVIVYVYTRSRMPRISGEAEAVVFSTRFYGHLCRIMTNHDQRAIALVPGTLAEMRISI